MTFFTRILFSMPAFWFAMMAAAAQSVAPNVIETIEFRGLSRVSVDFVKATILTKVGDVYNEAALHRDFKALWDTGRFNDIQVTKETGTLGGLVMRFIVTERETDLASNVIEEIEIRGLNRVPEGTVSALILSKAGDVYDEKAVGRDFKALWDTGRFSDIQVKKETGKRGGVVVRFVVTERP